MDKEQTKLLVSELRKLNETLENMSDKSLSFDFKHWIEKILSDIEINNKKSLDEYDMSIIEKGLPKYRNIMDMFKRLDVGKDAGFIRTYSGFYRIRRNDNWRKPYFEFMERSKNEEVSFSDVINFVYQKTGRVEASFSSKLLATLYPDFPIWDQYVLKNLNLRLKSYYSNKQNQVNDSIRLYTRIVKWYQDFVNSDEGKQLISTFDSTFPKYSWLTPTKKVDFMLWSKR